MNGQFSLILMFYLVCHIPAFVMLTLGLILRNKKPQSAKKLLIKAGIYFLVGAGICGGMFV